jgi:predicted SprT family Zn-dependent metalloprotease
LDRAYLSKCRKRIKNASLDENTSIEVTERKVQLWFNIINAAIFNNRLPKFHEIEIGSYRTFHALCECDDATYTLKIKSKFESRKRFIEVIAHEMIHLYEWVEYEKMSHGKNFYEWKNKLKRYNLDLYKNY